MSFLDRLIERHEERHFHLVDQIDENMPADMAYRLAQQIARTALEIDAMRQEASRIKKGEASNE